MSDGHSEDEYDDVPLQHKKPFGSGLRQKQVVFVPASSGGPEPSETSVPAARTTSVAEMYLSLVLPKDSASPTPKPGPARLCEVCELPLDEEPQGDATGNPYKRKHEASLAHQVCLTHSHPPSALDRSRMGLAVLKAQGWNPDSRSGLGAQQQGMHYPIKVKPKDDTLGIGVKVPKNLEPKKDKVEKLDAKKSRRMALDDKKRRERLERQFNGNPDVERYLGTG